MVLETVQSLKNRIFSKYMGSSITELPIFRKKKINWNFEEKKNGR